MGDKSFEKVYGGVINRLDNPEIRHDCSRTREFDWESIRYMHIEKKLDVIIRILDAVDIKIDVDKAKKLGLDNYLKK